MTDLKGKTALVTGSTSGIGRATTVALAARGAHILVMGRNEQRAADVVARSNRVVAYTAGLTGSVRVKSPVSSTTLAREVSGARAGEVKTAPMATTAYRAAWPAPGPKMWLAISPNAMPEVTPMNSETAATAGALGFLGALLGTLAAYIGAIGWLRGNSVHGGIAALGDVPVANLLVILIGLPLVATAAGWLLAGRQPPGIARQPIE